MATDNRPERPSNPAETRRRLEHLINAQEIERQRIAARLHDHAMQAMVAAALRVQLLTAQLPEHDHHRNLNPLNDAVSAAIGHIRELIFALRPGALDYARLPFVLENFIDQVTADWEVQAKLHYAVDSEPPPHLALTIFRIIQEALDNVRRHAQATDVHVRVMPRDSGILCEVTDNGIGSETSDRAPGAESLGLMEMTARAKSVGGWLELRGERGAGTTLRFWVPTVEGDEPQGPTP